AFAAKGPAIIPTWPSGCATRVFYPCRSTPTRLSRPGSVWPRPANKRRLHKASGARPDAVIYPAISAFRAEIAGFFVAGTCRTPFFRNSFRHGAQLPLADIVLNDFGAAFAVAG